MIVVDANVIAYALIQGDKTGVARSLRSHDPDWRVPRLWRYEFANILATFLLTKGLAPDPATRILQEALATFSGAEEDPDPADALSLAASHRITAYDAQYMALAKHLKVRLVTEDTGLQRAFRGIAVSMQSFLGLSA